MVSVEKKKRKSSDFGQRKKEENCRWLSCSQGALSLGDKRWWKEELSVGFIRGTKLLGTLWILKSHQRRTLQLMEERPARRQAINAAREATERRERRSEL